MANREMHDYWNGEQASAWVARQAAYDGMLEPYAEQVLDLAVINEADRVLDLGCGTGALTRRAARRDPRGTAVGVDIAAPLLALARERSVGLPNVSFVEADVQTGALPPAEVVISRFGVMFFDDPTTAFANVHQAVEPGGRLSFVCWRTPLENDWVIVPLGAATTVLPPPEVPPPGAPGPFAFADRNHVAIVLTEAGWGDIQIDADDREILLGGGLHAEEATDFFLDDGFGQRMTGEATDEERGRARAAVLEALTPHDGPDGVALHAATWLVRARRQA